MGYSYIFVFIACRLFHNAQAECTPGSFGSRCQFQCSCKDEISCDPVTGECGNGGCRDDSWGIGCMLDNTCTYNDDEGFHYSGKMSKTINNESCTSWSRQTLYKLSDFADKDIADVSEVSSYCRNPRRSQEEQAFCFVNRRRGDNRRFEYCPLRSCSCPAGRFGVNCARECHCMNPDEQCNPLSGECVSECHPSWTGLGCQQCSEGWFGGYCHQRCHCQDVEESCDNVTGVCLSGCAAGWTDVDCQTACSDGFFGPGCELQCHCNNSTERCNSVDGTCAKSGCASGYVGAGCQTMLPTMIHVPTITTRTATSLTVNWRDWTAGSERGSGPVTGYILYYKPLGNAQWQSTLPNITRPFTVSGLSSNQQYSVKVAAVHQSGAIGSPSPIVSDKTCGRPLSGPTSMKLTPVEPARDESGVPDDEEKDFPELTEPSDNTYDATSLSVVWKLPVLRQINCVSQLQSRIYTRRPEDDDFVLVANVSSGGLRTQLTDINPYVNLTVGVTIVNSAWLESDMIEDTYVGRSGPVDALKADSVSNTTALVIKWSHPTTSNGIINSYMLSYRPVSRVTCSETPLESSRLKIIMPNETETLLMDLSPFSTYEVKVMAKTNAGLGQAAFVTCITGSKEPPSVAGLHLINVTATSARLMWTRLFCRQFHGWFSGYEFQLTELGGDDREQQRVAAADVISGTEITFSNLTPLTNYSLTVSLQIRKVAPRASSIDFMTLAEDVPSPPGNFSLQSKLCGRISISWLEPQPSNGILTKYTVRYRQSDIREYTVIELDAASHECIVTDLRPSTAYILQIQATTRAGSGAWSEELEYITGSFEPDCVEHDIVTQSLNASLMMTVQSADAIHKDHWLQNVDVQVRAGALVLGVIVTTFIVFAVCAVIIVSVMKRRRNTTTTPSSTPAKIMLPRTTSTLAGDSSTWTCDHIQYSTLNKADDIVDDDVDSVQHHSKTRNADNVYELTNEGAHDTLLVQEHSPKSRTGQNAKK